MQKSVRLSHVVVVAVGLMTAGGISAEDEYGDTTFEDSGEAIIESPRWDLRPSLDAEGSVLWSDGIVLQEYSLYSQISSDLVDIGIIIVKSEFDVDYEPQIFGRDIDLSEDTERYAIDGSLALGSQWSVNGAAGYYEGFTNYRSLWISEYFGQLFGGLDDNLAPMPKGSNFSLGAKWEYMPVVATISLTAGYSKDTIAPGYEFGANGLVSGRRNLYTKTLQLQAENVITPRLVVQNTAQHTDTTNREKRWAMRTSVNCAITDSCFFRLQGGFSLERPNFDAVYGGASLEFEFTDGWFFRLNSRYYIDTGEIENGLSGFTSSAPPLETFELGAGLRWQGVHGALNLYTAYYQTEYESLGEDNAFLQNLYNDRRWGIVQLSYTCSY